ncbi:hypothetical protein AWH56_015680 [Anaerobacillus isosaccharinicus]|uniref:Uncharacterized protein n=1 Tax=Anaerobacillus isosaccharinicus TaxID=1532552 RepID=A0A1S2L9U3_9BACI|nr:hypothetical protein [Anaerobacillus isosaccharinicus]MBA5587659.1 hypothetical protein [Anaerobacillus isosaccharinicus]QOY34168.1 hypothetical protein AWH56_015680 [Anaerobacillus isosaccharinicus]
MSYLKFCAIFSTFLLAIAIILTFRFEIEQTSFLLPLIIIQAIIFFSYICVRKRTINDKDRF